MTTAVEKVKSFLERKLEENNLKRAHIAQGAGVSTFTIHNIVGESHDNVSFKVVLKLANYFKCSIDEVLERENFKDIKTSEYKPITFESSMERIKEFIRIKMEDTGLDIYKFARICGLGRTALQKFIMNGPTHKSIDSNNLLSIVDTFNISIDELIGRKEVNPKILQSKEKADSPSIKPEVSDSVLKNFSAQSADEAKNLQKSLKSFQSPVVHKVNVNNTPYSKVKTPSHSR